jgi:hypothetical protein
MTVGKGEPTNLAGCNDRVGRGRDGPGRQHAARDAPCVLARGQEPPRLGAAAAAAPSRVGRRARHAAEPRPPRPAKRGAGRGGRGDTGRRCHADARCGLCCCGEEEQGGWLSLPGGARDTGLLILSAYPSSPALGPGSAPVRPRGPRTSRRVPPRPVDGSRGREWLAPGYFWAKFSSTVRFCLR